jgi:hypothetical protein
MTDIQLLGGSLVLAGVYITYQTILLARYRRILTLARLAMESLLADLTALESKDEATSSE